MDTITFTKTAPPRWLLAMWKEIDDKTFGKGFDCFAAGAAYTRDRRICDTFMGLSHIIFMLFLLITF
jgi:hypothetical protein